MTQSVLMLVLGLALFGFRFHALAKSVLFAAVLAAVSIIGATITYRRIDH